MSAPNLCPDLVTLFHSRTHAQKEPNALKTVARRGNGEIQKYRYTELGKRKDFDRYKTRYPDARIVESDISVTELHRYDL